MELLAELPTVAIFFIVDQPTTLQPGAEPAQNFDAHPLLPGASHLELGRVAREQFVSGLVSLALHRPRLFDSDGAD